MTGELDNNLFTNQSLVGKTAVEISEQVVIKLEFYDYLSNKLDPTTLRVKRDVSSSGFNVTTTYEPHVLGKISEAVYQARWQIIDGNLVITAANSSNQNKLTEIYYFMLKELTTNDKSYTKFKYVQ